MLTVSSAGLKSVSFKWHGRLSVDSICGVFSETAVHLKRKLDMKLPTSDGAEYNNNKCNNNNKMSTRESVNWWMLPEKDRYAYVCKYRIQNFQGDLYV